MQQFLGNGTISTFTQQRINMRFYMPLMARLFDEDTSHVDIHQSPTQDFQLLAVSGHYWLPTRCHRLALTSDWRLPTQDWLSTAIRSIKWLPTLASAGILGFISLWDLWPRFLFCPRHVRVLEVGSPLQHELRHPSHYVLCHCTVLCNTSTRHTEVSCQWRHMQQVMP
jgi:hypothetical protein